MTTSERNISQVSRHPLPWRSSRSCPWGRWGDFWATCWRPCCLPVLRTRRWSLACVCACVCVCLHLGQCQQEGWAAALWVKKHVSVVVQLEEIPFVARASVVEELLCWKGFRVSVPARRLSDCFRHIHLFLSFPFYRLCPLVSSPSINFVCFCFFLLWTVVLLLLVYPLSSLGHSFTPLFPESTAAPHNTVFRL